MRAGIGTGSAVASADAPGPALLKLEREAIAAASQISYPQSELMVLIHEHLNATGLHAAAQALAQEANLAAQAGSLPQEQHKPQAQRDLNQAMEEAGTSGQLPHALPTAAKAVAASSGAQMQCNLCAAEMVGRRH